MTDETGTIQCSIQLGHCIKSIGQVGVGKTRLGRDRRGTRRVTKTITDERRKRCYKMTFSSGSRTDDNLSVHEQFTICLHYYPTLYGSDYALINHFKMQVI